MRRLYGYNHGMEFYRFRNCHAGVAQGSIYVAHVDELDKIENAKVLMSYASIVAIFDDDARVLYKLPRAHYSRTTAKQVTMFANECADGRSYFVKNADGFSTRKNPSWIDKW